jgi:acetoin utilization deacetylase AcuC-like enzyme
MQGPARLQVFYSTEMVSDSGRMLSPSDHKPRDVAEAITRTPWPVDLVPPQPSTLEDLCRVHDPSFVVDVLELRRASGFGTMSPSVARSLPYTCGSFYCAAVTALRDGISASLSSGFHHAGPKGGRGFCTFNGLMVATTRLLATGQARKVAIIDCDYHFGDGTQAIVEAQSLQAQVLHVSFGLTYKRPEQAGDYLFRMRELKDELATFRPDLVLYQAGADTHVDDPLGGLLTTEQMRERDRTMFTVARDLGLPLAWNLAGGYQVEPDGSIPKVVQLHLNTFEEALRTWRLI